VRLEATSVVAMRKAWEISDVDVRLQARIDGSSPGAFGEVWRADWDGIAVAVKVLRLSTMDLDQSTRRPSFSCVRGTAVSFVSLALVCKPVARPF